MQNWKKDMFYNSVLLRIKCYSIGRFTWGWDLFGFGGTAGPIFLPGLTILTASSSWLICKLAICCSRLSAVFDIFLQHMYIHMWQVMSSIRIQTYYQRYFVIKILFNVHYYFWKFSARKISLAKILYVSIKYINNII